MRAVLTPRALDGVLAPGPPQRFPVLAQAASAMTVSVVAGGTLAVTGDWRVVVGLFAVAALVAVGALRPALFVSLFILVRPLLDGYSSSELGGVSSANPAGGLGVLLLGVSLMVLVGAPSFVRPRATLALVGVLAVSAIACVQAVLNIGEAIGAEPLSELARLGALLAIYLLAANLFTTPANVKKLFVIVGLSGMVPAVAGLVQWIQGVELAPGQELARISGTFSGPLTFSTYLALCLVVLIALPRDLLRPWLRFGAIAVMGAALVGTYGRQGWILLLLCVVLLEWRRRQRIIVAAGIVMAILILTVPAVGDRVLPSGTSGEDKGAYSSYDWRIDNWAGLLDVYTEQPLVGHGLKSETFVNPRKTTTGQGEAGGGYGSHNAGVKFLVEGGILLLAVYLALLWVVLQTLRRVRRDAWPLQPFARVLLVLWAVLAFLAFTTDDPFGATATMYAVFALTGSLEGAHRRWRETEGQAPNGP